MARWPARQDLYDLPDDGYHHYELDAGRLVVSEPPGYTHGTLAVRIAARILAFAEPRGLGSVAVESGFVLHRGPDTVRGPDVSFLRRERVPRGDEADKFVEGTPDLAVEIVSPGDRAGKVARTVTGYKVTGYLASGAGLVWGVYPRKRLVVVHTPDGGKRLVREPEVLDGGAVLPGFTLPLAAGFAQP